MLVEAVVVQRGDDQVAAKVLLVPGVVVIVKGIAILPVGQHESVKREGGHAADDDRATL